MPVTLGERRQVGCSYGNPTSELYSVSGGKSPRGHIFLRRMVNHGNFKQVNNSALYLAENGLEAAIVSEIGIGNLELGICRERLDDNLLSFSGLGIIAQNHGMSYLPLHDHHGDGRLAQYCFGGAKYNYYHFQEPLPIREKHIQQYLELYATSSLTFKKEESSASVQKAFRDLKGLSLELHRLAIIVTRDYVIEDMKAWGWGKKKRQNILHTGIFDKESNYFIASYQTNLGQGQGTVEKETYPDRRIGKQLNLFNPPH